MINKHPASAYLSRALIVWALAPAAALAVPVMGTSSGVFSNAAGPSGMVASGLGTNHFSWGAPGPASELLFLGNSVSSMVGEVFSLGALYFHNTAIAPGTEAQSVDLIATLALTMPGTGSHLLSMPLTLVHTPNTTADPTSPDFVLFPVSVPSRFFSVDGLAYAFEFVGFGGINGESFTTFGGIGAREGRTAAVLLLGRVSVPGSSTTSPVPEPSTLALLGLGLAAGGLVRRR